MDCICLFAYIPCTVGVASCRPDTGQAGVASAAEEPIPGIFRGFDLTLESDSLYDLVCLI